MAIVVSGIKLPLQGKEEQGVELALKKAKLKKNQVSSCTVVKKSVDARKGELNFVYSIAIETVGIEQKAYVDKLSENQVVYREEVKLVLEKGEIPLEAPPIVVGFGPGGMFAALLLARHGYCPIVLERGSAVDERVKAVEGFWHNGKLNTQSNVQFGEGGAGTFSDGKLTTRTHDPRCSWVLKELVAFGGTEDILIKAKPHIGTDKLRGIVKAIREEIIALGGQVHFNCPVEDIQTEKGKITGVSTPKGQFNSNHVIFAIGHSARDTFYMLKGKGVHLSAKAFSVGARIEHLQSEVNRSLYGKHSENPLLPIGEYQLSQRFEQRAAYTFCMCPGGTVVGAASEDGRVVVNGMSEYARNLPNANSAFVVSVDEKQYGGEWDSGILFQRQLEEKAFTLGGGNYVAPAQTVGSFLGKHHPLEQGVTPSYPLGVKEVDLKELFPTSVSQLMVDALPIFARKLSCFGQEQAVLTGVETRTSSPVRMERGDNLCSITIDGLYPCGEGAGYAGGIMSAAVDGIRVASQIIGQFSPKKFKE